MSRHTSGDVLATPQQRRTVRWAHSRARLRWWTVAVVVLPLAISIPVGVGNRAAVETALRERTVAALAGVGVRGAAVDFEGVQGEVGVPATVLPAHTSLRQIEQALSGVEGAHTLDVDVVGESAPSSTPAAPAPPIEVPATEVPATEAPAAPDPCADPQAGVDALLGPDRVAFGDAGAVLAGAELVQVQQVASLLSGCGRPVRVVGRTADRAPGPSTVAQQRATAVAAVLAAAGLGVVTVRGGRSGSLGDNATAAGRRLNRYADIRVG